MESLFGGEAPVTYVAQDLVPPQRRKPWGTGHAILSAGTAVDGPFAVMNADDWYGPHGYRILFDHLETFRDHDPPVHALVGYRLSDTPLSDAGGVSRGICTTDGDGMLQEIVEVRNIRPANGEFTGRTASGETVRLVGSQTASMNLWGFLPDIFSTLVREFESFREEAMDDPDSEFLVGSAINAGIRSGDCRVSVIPASDSGFGMTYSDDLPAVRRRISDMIRSGLYPEDLRAALGG